MENTYRCAIIGVGAPTQTWAKGGGHQIGYSHARMIEADPRLELVAAADIHSGNLRAFQEKFSVTKGYADYRAMLEEQKPDIVSICTYVGLHEPMAVACAERGVKGIFLEKPIVHSPAALRRLSQAIDESGIKVAVAHVRRYIPSLRNIRDELAAGTIGQPLLFMAGIDGWDLCEWGSHWLDAFRFFNGDRPVSWVTAQGRVRDLRGYGHAMEDHAVACFEFDNHARGLLDGGRRIGSGESDCAGAPPVMTIVGTEGVMYLREWLKKLEILGADGKREVIDPAGGDRGENRETTWAPYAAGMVSWLDGGDPPPTAWEFTRGTAELNLAAYLSMLRGDRIDLPWDEEAAAIDEWPLEIFARR